MDAPTNPENAGRCEARLGELTDADLTDLRYFAQKRLLRSGQAADLARDVVQTSLQSVIQGLEATDLGRRPRPEDTESKEAFANYLRGVVNSKVEALSRCRDFRVRQVAVVESAAREGGSTVGEVDSGVVLTAPEISPGEQVGWEDYRTALFSRLRERAPQRLHRDIAKWEPVFLSSKSIPARGRNYVEIKQLAQAIVTELGGIA